MVGEWWVDGVQSDNRVKPNQVKVRLWLGWDFDNNDNNKTTLKQLGCDLIVISLVLIFHL